MSKKTSNNIAKRISRLVAVQVLYQVSYKEETVDVIMRRAKNEVSSMLNENTEEQDEYTINDKPNMELVSYIVNGVIDNNEPLSEMVSGALTSKSSDRMERLFKAIFLSGVYELLHNKDVDAKIIINDYVDVAKSFFQGKEAGLVNAVLDRLAKKIRA